MRRSDPCSARFASRGGRGWPQVGNELVSEEHADIPRHRKSTQLQPCRNSEPLMRHRLEPAYRPSAVAECRLRVARALAVERALTPARRRILELIAIGATERTELATRTGTSVSTVKKHLAALCADFAPDLSAHSVAALQQFIGDLALQDELREHSNSSPESIGSRGRPPSIHRPPFATPRSIRRELVRELTAGGFRRVPAPTGRHADVVLVVSALKELTIEGSTLCVDPSEQQACERAHLVPSIAALIVDGAAAALEDGGVTEAIRSERPDTPILVVNAHLSGETVGRLRLIGAQSIGPSTECQRAAMQFADLARAAAQVRRRTLDARAVAWSLTPREAEIAWLASMVTSLPRAEQLFAGGGFRTQLSSVRSKVGARSYAHLGLIARS